MKKSVSCFLVILGSLQRADDCEVLRCVIAGLSIFADGATGVRYTCININQEWHSLPRPLCTVSILIIVFKDVD